MSRTTNRTNNRHLVAITSLVVVDSGFPEGIAGL